MGWGKFLFLGGLGNRLDLDSAESEIRTLRAQIHTRSRQTAAVEDRLRQLADENAELKLYLASVVRLLISKGLIGQEEFARFVEVVDSSDGAADGKFRGQVGGGQ